MLAHEALVAIARDRQLTLLLDLDGTLVPFAPTPDATTIDRPLRMLFASLRASGIGIVVVSGRPRPSIERLSALVPDVWWVAEHGAWCSRERARWIGHDRDVELDDLAAALAAIAVTPGALLERKSLSLCLHWRLVPTAIKGGLISAAELACDEWLETHPAFERLDGAEIVEVRRRSINKGTAVAWVRDSVPGARVIAIGDDATDEDMFAALSEGELAIGVGPSRAHAPCWLPGPTAVRAFLRWLIECRTTPTVRTFPSLESRSPAERPTARVVVASHRVPAGKTAGGLVAALEPALRTTSGAWLGWSGHESAGERRLLVDTEVRPMRAAFDFPPGLRERFDGFCGRALWPLFHGFPSRVSFTDGDWQAYHAANDELARHVRELVAPSGTVWLHDYHLLLAGRALRDRGFTGPLGLFLHIPFPPPEVLVCLPWAAEIVDAMRAFDLIGFHTAQWMQNFRDFATGSGDTLPDLAALPIGIDASLFAAEAGPPDREVAGLQAALGARRLILGVDRLDYAKGIPERLLAYEHLLERHPEWQGKVALVQISVPSREEVPEYAELRHRVETLVGRINGKFGETTWVPVRYLYRAYDQRVLAQLYRAADVALVTPLCDGMNLVAKEFVAAQDPAQPGVLVLSRFAGAATELADAVLTNPFHPEGLADDLDRALRMASGERRRRHDLLARAIAGKTPRLWADAFLARLESARHRAA